MSILQRIINFFKNLFFSKASGGTQLRTECKKCEAELKQVQPSIYKNGTLLPAFGELIFLLYTHTSVLFKLLSFMGPGGNVHIKERLFDMLIHTGYSQADKEKWLTLSFEERKRKMEASSNIQREIESQNHSLEDLLAKTRSNTFIQIEQTLKNLSLLYDLCAFNYISLLNLFNPDFDPVDPQNTFISVPIGDATESLLDLYYICSALEINASLARALLACAVHSGSASAAIPEEEIIKHIKKIATVLTKVLTPTVLKNCILVGKNDASFTPETAKAKSSPLADFAARTKSRFASEAERIKVELQDRQLEIETKNLFDSLPLLELQAYNADTNKILKDESAESFLWITPVQIIKTFLNRFFEEQTTGFLNDIILEGFFTNPEQKTEFASAVYACIDASRIINNFEQSFNRGSKNDIALILSHVKDGHKDPVFSRQLATMVATANADAKEVVQTQVSYLYDLYRMLVMLFEDSHNSTPTVMSNIKLLFTSSRNRSRADLVEQSLPKWALFLSIMKNYAVIGSLERRRQES